MTTNGSCELCGGRTTIEYAGACGKITVLRSHILIAGGVICDTCINELINEHTSLTKRHPRSKIKLNAKLVITNWTWRKGQTFMDKED